jgi:hypothetical protein
VPGLLRFARGCSALGGAAGVSPAAVGDTGVRRWDAPGGGVPWSYDAVLCVGGAGGRSSWSRATGGRVFTRTGRNGLPAENELLEGEYGR